MTDTATNKVIGQIPIGQAPQAIAYVPNAVPEGDGMQNLQPLGVAGHSANLALAPAGKKAATNVTLFDQGLIQVVQAAATGLEPKKPYVLALSRRHDGQGKLEPLAAFMTNPAGSAIVNAAGPIRQIVQSETKSERRYLVIAPGNAENVGTPVQVQIQ